MVAKAKKILGKLVNREKANAASRTESKFRGKKRTTAVDEHVATLQTELAKAKASYSRLVEDFTRFELDANNAQTGLQDSPVRLAKVQQGAKLAKEDRDKVWQQFLGLAEAAKKTLLLPTEVSNQADAFQVEFNSLKSHMNEVFNTRSNATSAANEKRQEA